MDDASLLDTVTCFLATMAMVGDFSSAQELLREFAIFRGDDPTEWDEEDYEDDDEYVTFTDCDCSICRSIQEHENEVN